MTLTMADFKVGEKVYFGRKGGEQTLGEVVSKGRAKLKVKQLEARGTMKAHAVGTIWTVPPALCTKADANTAPATTTTVQPPPSTGSTTRPPSPSPQRPGSSGCLRTARARPSCWTGAPR